MTRIVVPPEAIPDSLAERLLDLADGDDPIITCTPGLMGGAPCFRGTRVPRDTVDAEIAAGNSVDEIMESYPTLDRDDLESYVAAVAFLKADRTRSDKFDAWLNSLEGR